MRPRTILFSSRLSGAPLVFFLICLLAAFMPTAMANPIAIQDASFDNRSLSSGGKSTTLTPWLETGGTANGNGWIERVSGFAADGQNHLGMNPGHNVWQDLGVTYQANMRYTLNVAVGNRSGQTQFGNDSRYHLAATDGTVFATGSYDARRSPSDRFINAPSVVFDTGAHSPAIGKTIRILLEARGVGRTHFDNIRLSAVTTLPPPATTLSATDVTDRSATLNGTVNAMETNAVVTFEYGPTPAYGEIVFATPFTLTGNANTPVAASVHGLSPETTYHFRVVATNPIGVSYGVDQTFTTAPALVLSGLVVSEGSLMPEFSPAVTTYALQVSTSSTSIRVTPLTGDPDASILVQNAEVTPGASSEPMPLIVGNTMIAVDLITSGASFVKTYEIIVTRPPDSFVFTDPDSAMISAPAFDASGLSIDVSLGFAPAPAASLTVVNNTGQDFIKGRFTNLAHGEIVILEYGGITYSYVANYYGGTGNDLVLEWANTRLMAWGSNQNGQLGTGNTTSSPVPVAVDGAGVLNGKTITSGGAGEHFNVVLSVDGFLSSWGANAQYGQLGNNRTTNSSIPVNVDTSGVLAGKSVIAVATGVYHSLALCADGTLASWGRNEELQLGAGSGFNQQLSRVPVLVNRSGVLAGKTVVAMSAGLYHSLVLCSDGTLAAWGNNAQKQLGDGGFTNSPVPVLVKQSGFAAGKKAVRIATGSNFCLVLYSDGTLAAWGNNSSGQLGIGTTSSNSNVVQTGNIGVLAGKHVIDIAAGSSYVIALCSDGTLAAWGSNSSGQLGNNSTTSSPVPVAVDRSGVLAGKTVATLAAGSSHSMALCSDGTLATWGNGANSSTNPSSNSSVPVQVNASMLKPGERFARVIAAGSSHRFAVVASPPPPVAETLAATGIGDNRATLNSRVYPNGFPTTVSFEYGLTTDYGATIAANPAVWNGTGTVAASGTLEGLLTNTTYHYRVLATNAYGTWRGEDLTFTTSGFSTLAGLTLSTGDMIPGFAPINTNYAVTVPNATDRITLTPFAAFAGASITVNGTPVASGATSGPVVLAEGDNRIDILVSAADGINSQTYTVTVTRVPQRLRFDSPGSVPLNVSSLRPSGTMIGFDLGHHPHIGTDLVAIRQAGLAPIDGEFDNLAQGQRIILSHDGIGYEFVADYFGGDGNDLVLRWANTRLFGWGAHQFGRLGISSPTFVSVPTPVNSSELLTGHAIKAVSAGGLFTMVLRADGVVVGFGSNQSGQLGNSTVPWQTLEAVEVDRSGVLAGRTVVAISAGSGHTLALCSDGTLAAWGGGSGGQLGNNSTGQSYSPVEVDRTGVLAGRRIVAIAAGSGHSLALCRDGRLFAWGWNVSGQLGNGTLTNSPVPVEVDMGGVLAGKRVMAIAAGNSHSLVLCEDGTLATWGSNSDGQLGNNDELNSSVPVTVDRSGVLSGKSVATIAAGAMHNFALCSDGTLVAWGSGSNGALGDGIGSSSSHKSEVPVAVLAAGALDGKEVVDVVGGISFSLALCSDGSTAGWGGGASGQLGDGTRSFNNPVPVEVNRVNFAPGEHFVRLASGPSSYHSLGIVGSPPPPAAATHAATSVRDKSATLNGTVMASGSVTSVSFEFGPTPEYGTTFEASPAVVEGAVPTAVNFTVDGLVPGRTYHYRVVATGPGGTIYGEVVSFSTTTLSTLSGLSIIDAALDPAFDFARTRYTSTVPFGIESVTVTPLANHLEATLRVNGATAASGEPGLMLPLSVGINPITVEVTSGDGENSMSYVIDVIRMPAEIYWSDAEDIPLEASGFLATGDVPPLVLGHAPHLGASLMLVNNIGDGPVAGKFANLDHGQQLQIEFDGITYPFFANYSGGDGNDLTLDWANTRIFSWGAGNNGRLGNGETVDRWLPTPVVDSGILAGRAILDVAASHTYSVALSADGTLAAWGDISSGVFDWDFNDGTLSPVGIATDDGNLAGRTVISLAAGEEHALALCSDGTVVVLGMESQVMNTGALAGKRVVAIEAGAYGLSIALCSDGTVATWAANNDSGQLGNGTSTASSVPVAVDMTGVLAGKRVVKIAAGAYHCLALCSDGTLVAWGSNSFGSLGIGGSSYEESRPVLVDRSGALAGKTITDIAAGRYHSLACCSDGTVAAWGWNMFGQLGDGSTNGRKTPTLVNRTGALAGKAVTSVFAGESHSMTLCSDGTLVTWGENSSGQLGNNTTTNSTVPVIVDVSQLRPGERFTRRSHVSSYGFHNLAVAATPPPPQATTLAATDIEGVGAVLRAEVRPNGSPTTVRFEFGLSDAYGTTHDAVPATVVGSGSRAVELSLRELLPGTTYHYRVVASNHGGTVIGEEGTFTTLSDNARLTGITSRIFLGLPFHPDTLDYFGTLGFGWESVELRPRTEHPGATVEVNGEPLTAGVSQPVPLEVGNNPITIGVIAEDRVTTRTYTIVVTRLPEKFVLDGIGAAPVSARGFRAFGNVPEIRLDFHPPTGSILTLVKNTSLLPISGRFSNLAHGQRVWLSHDGEWYAFVANYYGGTGNDLVLQWAGTRVAAWGLNNYGQLGDGSATQRLRPVAADDSGMLADKTIFALATGYLHSVALTSDGKLASWGYNVQGQLGNNALANSSAPVPVDTSGVLADKVVVAIASGSYHNLALCSNGTVVAWGFNNHGQLGSGTKTIARTPVLVKMDGVLAGKQVVAIAAGAYQSYALCSDGTIAAWGYNDEGELGNGSKTSSLVPVAVDVSGALAGREVAAISAGQYHALALCTDGTVVSWGYNQRGQLGNSTTADSGSPVEINSFGALEGKSVKAIAAGASHSLALCSDGTLVTWGFNSQSQLGATGINQSTTPVAVAQPNRPLVSLTVGANHNLLCFTDGSMTTWGGNSNGQLGSNNTQASAAPVDVDTSSLDHGGFIMFAASACASSHNLAVFAVPVDVPASLVAPSGLNAWRLEHFSDIGVDHPLAANNADFDGDGIPNLVEYAFGLNPRAHCGGILPQPQRSGDHFELRFSRTLTTADIEYGAEWSPDLQPGSWRDVPDSGNAAEHLFSMPMDTAPRLFMRLRVRLGIHRKMD